jgi:uncharacterized protein (TIGR02118 family)
MHRSTVLYGHPKNPTEFDRYCQEVHIPIAQKRKGLKGWVIAKCQSALAGEAPQYYMAVGLYADTHADLDAILASLEGQATIADVPHFATGGYTFMFDDEMVLIPCALRSHRGHARLLQTQDGVGSPNTAPLGC